MNRRSFLARFIGGLAAVSMRLEMPKVEEPNRLTATEVGIYYRTGNRLGKTRMGILEATKMFKLTQEEWDIIANL